MPPKDVDGEANREDPDQTAAPLEKEQSDLGLLCMHRPICLKLRTIVML